MNLTGAIDVTVLTIHVDAERYDGFWDTNGNESPRRKDCECPLCPTSSQHRTSSQRRE
jgi:hypothetical protein